MSSFAGPQAIPRGEHDSPAPGTDAAVSTVRSLDKRMIRFYSENGEDCFVWNLLDFKSDGTVIDVGAFDGKYLSNSLSFSENGWKGLCVEPLAAYADLCRKNQPNSICVHAACVADEETTSVEFSSEPLGVYSRLVVKEGDLHRLQDSYRKHGEAIEGFQVVEVPAVTLWNLVRQYLPNTPVDLLSIDVEGGEIEVLKGGRMGDLKPRVVCAEANSPEGRQALDEFLAPCGYVYLRSMGNNHFYSAEAELIERAKTIAIRCAIERQVHPRGARFTFPGILSGKIIDEQSQQTIRGLQARLRDELHKNHLATEFLKGICHSEIDPPGDFRALLRTAATDFASALTGDTASLEHALQDARRKLLSQEKTFDRYVARNREVEKALADTRSALAASEASKRALTHRLDEVGRALDRCRGELVTARQGALLDRLDHQDFREHFWHVPVPGFLRAGRLAALAARQDPGRLSEPERSLKLLSDVIDNRKLIAKPRKTRLCVEGFPRSANSTLVWQVARLNPMLSRPNIIAHHTHNIVQVKVCVRLGIPSFVALRNPRDCVISYHLYSGLPMRTCLNRWVEYHRALLRLVSTVRVVTFEDITANGEAIARGILAIAKIPVLEDQVHKDTLQASRRRAVAAGDERKIGVPSAQRSAEIASMRARMPARYFDEAISVYEELLNSRRVLSPTSEPEVHRSKGV